MDLTELQMTEKERQVFQEALLIYSRNTTNVERKAVADRLLGKIKTTVEKDFEKFIDELKKSKNGEPLSLNELMLISIIASSISNKPAGTSVIGESFGEAFRETFWPTPCPCCDNTFSKR